MAGKPKAICRKGLHPMTPENVYTYPNGMRRCRACSRATDLRRHARDREKRNRASNERYHAAGEEGKRARRARRFGITVAELDALGSACSVCGMEDGDPEAGRWGRLHVDHDHASDEVRGLLCHRCNAMVGHALDDPARLRAAADYLEKRGDS